MFFFSSKKPRQREIYAVNAGQYIGEFFVYIDNSDDNTCYNFLSLPKMLKRIVPVESFKVGLKQKIIKRIERLPIDIYEMCKLQYNQLHKKASSKITEKI